MAMGEAEASAVSVGSLLNDHSLAPLHRLNWNLSIGVADGMVFCDLIWRTIVWTRSAFSLFPIAEHYLKEIGVVVVLNLLWGA